MKMTWEKSLIKSMKETWGISQVGMVEGIAKMIPNKKDIKILDVGCGRGDLEKILHKTNYKNVTCIDISSKLLKIIKKSYPSYNVKTVDLNKKLPFKDDAFDFAVCIEVLEHMYNPVYAISELARVSKTALITIPNASWAQITPHCDISKEGAVSFFTPTERTLKCTLRCLNLKILSWNYYYVTLGFIRKLFPNLLSSGFIVKFRKSKKKSKFYQFKPASKVIID